MAFCQSTGGLPNSRLSPLPPEPADFYDRGATIDIPLDNAKVTVAILEYYTALASLTT